MLSYDPDKVPNVDPIAFARARAEGLLPMLIACDVPGAKVGDNTAVQFFAFGAFLPRVGDLIKLEDGKTCKVREIYFTVSSGPDFKTVAPNIYAVLRSREADEPRE